MTFDPKFDFFNLVLTSMDTIWVIGVTFLLMLGLVAGWLFCGFEIVRKWQQLLGLLSAMVGLAVLVGIEVGYLLASILVGGGVFIIMAFGWLIGCVAYHIQNKFWPDKNQSQKDHPPITSQTHPVHHGKNLMRPADGYPPPGSQIDITV
jgi:hypothetical protein